MDDYEKECRNCDFNDPDFGCVCPSYDKWYACPLEPQPSLEDFLTPDEMIALQKE